MTRSGTTVGTVIRWDQARRGGIVEAPDLPGECWVEASVVAGASAADGLRAGQIVEIDWTEPDEQGTPLRATRVVRRDDLQAGPGG